MSGRIWCGVTLKHVAFASEMTRSGGIPLSAHFPTAWGDTGGVKMAPIAEYEPNSAHRRSKTVDSFMARSVNRQFSHVNCRLLHEVARMGNHQRMVETLTDRLKQLKGEMSLAAFGELADVTAQAAKKWMDGGNVSDRHLAKIAEKKGVSVHWLRYGDEAKKPSSATTAGLSPEAVEVARAWMRLPIYKQRGYAQGIMVDAAVVEVFPEIERAMRLAATASDPAYHKFTERFSRARETLMRQLELDLKGSE